MDPIWASSDGVSRQIYGTDTLADIANAVADEVADARLEGHLGPDASPKAELITAIQDNYDTVGAIVNPGALDDRRLEPA